MSLFFIKCDVRGVKCESKLIIRRNYYKDTSHITLRASKIKPNFCTKMYWQMIKLLYNKRKHKFAKSEVYFYDFYITY